MQKNEKNRSTEQKETTPVNLSDRLVTIREKPQEPGQRNWPPTFEQFAATCNPRLSLF
jgi:hypothetical protein